MKKFLNLTVLLIMIIVMVVDVQAQGNFFTPTNGPFGGMILSTFISASGDIYISTQTEGLYRSSNHGISWEQINNGLPRDPYRLAMVGTIVERPNGVLYATCSMPGLLRSTNAGDSWENILPDTLNIPTRSLIFGNDDTMYVSTDDRGIIRSVDLGRSWIQMNTGLPSWRTSLYLTKQGELLAGSEMYGLFAFDYNLGVWKNINNGLTPTYINAFASKSNGELFAGTDWGILFSSNHGARWEYLPRNVMQYIWTLAVTNHGDIIGGSKRGIIYRYSMTNDAWSMSKIQAPTRNHISDIYVAADGSWYVSTDANGLLRTLDEGQTWEELSKGVQPAYAFSLVSDASGRVYAGSSACGYVTTNSGTDWTRQIPANANRDFTMLAVNSRNDVFALADSLSRSTDNGVTWKTIHSGLKNAFVLVAGTDVQNHLYAFTLRMGIDQPVFRSTDNGETWDSISTITPYASPVCFVSNSLGHLFIGSNLGVLRSTDHGFHWIAMNDEKKIGFMSSLAVNSLGHLYAGCKSNQGLFRSTNEGDTWTKVDSGIAQKTIRAIAINANGHIFAGTDSLGVFRSTDHGRTWTDVSSGLRNLQVRALALDPQGFLYVGLMPGGVSRSLETTVIELPILRFPENNSIVETKSITLQWSPLNGAKTYQLQVAINPEFEPCIINVGNVMGTNHVLRDLMSETSYYWRVRGLNSCAIGNWSVSHSFITATQLDVRDGDKSIPTQVVLYQNLPNPFSRITNISYDLKSSSFTRLEVFDPLGRSVATLVDEPRDAGDHEVIFDARGLQAGVYIYRLISGGKTTTRKMLVVK